MEAEKSKEELMLALIREIASCKKCGLWKSRKNPVPGEGSLYAEVMFVGEAPGYNEDLQGRPFVGAAGKLLDKLIEERLGLQRRDVYIANVIKCRPPKNRDPLPEEIAKCTPFLDRQVEIISPRIIVTLGRHSARYILGKAGISFRSIEEVRGREFTVKFATLYKMFSVHVIPTYHPAAALYKPNLVEPLERDFDLVRELLKSLGD